MTPIPVPGQVQRRAWEAARQQFLAALREMLADPEMSRHDKTAEVLGTFSAIGQMAVLMDVKERT